MPDAKICQSYPQASSALDGLVMHPGLLSASSALHHIRFQSERPACLSTQGQSARKWNGSSPGSERSRSSGGGGVGGGSGGGGGGGDGEGGSGGGWW